MTGPNKFPLTHLLEVLLVLRDLRLLARRAFQV